ncbi:hypothetical protein BJY52DRAFT_1225415 [Lactarius psammicola]|nr:hypothetical protein BJY52DRAFT_1225415 [Lactarius psammicola]
MVKYPTRDAVTSEQGVGPHFDAGFLTFPAAGVGSPRPAGPEFVWAMDRRTPASVHVRPPSFRRRPNVLAGRGVGLESVTQGLARATSHRVLAPPAGTSPRYSIPFFQNIAQGMRLSEHVLEFPLEVLRLKGQRGELGRADPVNFSEYDCLQSGQVPSIDRVKNTPLVVICRLLGVARYRADEKPHRSHPDVAEKHYPDLFK